MNNFWVEGGACVAGAEVTDGAKGDLGGAMFGFANGEALAFVVPGWPNGEFEAAGFPKVLVLPAVPKGDGDAPGNAAGGFPNGLAEAAGAAVPPNGEGALILPELVPNVDAMGARESCESDGIGEMPVDGAGA